MSTTRSQIHKVIQIEGVQKYYSHYMWWLNTGHWPDFKNKQEVIHHIDGNPLNDNFSNLQLMTDAEHKSLHSSGSNNSMYGVKLSEKAIQRISGPNHSRWHGDSASASAKYMRHRNHPNLYPPLTEEERQEFNAYRREQYRERQLKKATA